MIGKSPANLFVIHEQWCRFMLRMQSPAKEKGPHHFHKTIAWEKASALGESESFLEFCAAYAIGRRNGLDSSNRHESIMDAGKPSGDSAGLVRPPAFSQTSANGSSPAAGE